MNERSETTSITQLKLELYRSISKGKIDWTRHMIEYEVSYPNEEFNEIRYIRSGGDPEWGRLVYDINSGAELIDAQVVDQEP